MTQFEKAGSDHAMRLYCRLCDCYRTVDDSGQSVHCQRLACLLGNEPARAKWENTCDLDPDCHDQGCTEHPDACQRVRDLRAGIDRRPDFRPECPVENCEGIPMDCQRVRDLRAGKVVVETNPSSPCSWIKRIFEEGT